MAEFQATLISDDLPADAQVVALSFNDAVSHPYVAVIDFATSDADLDLTALLGKPVAIRIDQLLESHDPSPLIVHGQVEEAEYVDSRAHVHHYRVALAPLMQALAHRVRSRIFQGKNVVDIVSAVFKDAGIPSDAVVWHVTPDDYPPREFCVQYQESELAFVMRLLEEEGIFFCFAHTETAHVLHLAAKTKDLPTIPGEPLLPAFPDLHVGREAVTELVLSRRVTSDLFSTRDWDFMSPDKPIEASADVLKTPSLERYEYPGTFHSPTDGGRVARVRADEVSMRARVLRGESNSVRLLAGRKLGIEGAAIPMMDGEYVVLSARTRFRAPFFTNEAGADAADDGASKNDQASYLRVSFEMLPEGVPLRPERRTPKPRIYGIQSAVVTGPSGEEIHVDEFGRIKVHFYWDREGKLDDKASCWIRVQQQNTSGSMILPRIGWELAIAFLDGDPDRPVALQKLYNRETMPPYGMPGNKTQSSLQSSTSPGGGATNEIRLQDGSGGMEFFVHSSKDLAVKAGNDEIEEIKVNCHDEIGLELQTTVGVDETVKIGAAHSLSVTGNATEETIGNKGVTVGALDDWGVTGNFGLNTTGNRTESVGGMMNVLANQVLETYNAKYQRTVGAILSMNTASALVEAVAGSKTETIGGAKLELIAKTKAESVGGSKTLNSGLITEKTDKDLQLSTKAALTIAVGGPIAEKCGEAYTIGAAAVVVTSGGGADIKVGGTKFSAKGGKLTINASNLGASGGPMLKLKGDINFKG